MNKTEVIQAVAAHAEVDPSTTGAVIDALLDVVQAKVAAGEKVSFTGILAIEKVHRAATTARNPQNGEMIEVAAKDIPKVSVGAVFKRVVNGQSPAPVLKPGA